MKTINFTLALCTALLCVFCVSGCGNGKTDKVKVDEIEIFLSGKADKELNTVFTSVESQADVKNLAIMVQSPQQNYAWSKASGLANPDNAEPMTTTTPFRIASVSKTFTAALILQQIERGVFTLDTPLMDILSDADMPAGYLLSDLHILDGVSRGEQITIRQLLNHSSGFRDYQFDPPDNDPQSISLATASLEDITGINPTGASKIQWSSSKIMDYFFNSGMHRHARSLPGERHYYTDTSYVILGMIIEKLTGQLLADNYRQLIFDPLNMDYAHLDWYETSPIAGPAHHYWNIEFANIVGNFDIIANDINTSAEWAGGGIVCTLKELNTFVHALFEQKLYSQESTLESMRDTIATGEQNLSYGLGLERKEYRVSNKTIEVFGHSGLWGVGMYYIPATGTSITYTFNQVTTLRKDWLFEILIALDKAKLFTAVKN